MRKCFVIAIVLAALTGVGFLQFNPTFYLSLRAWYYGESYYGGWPTSLWIRAIQKDPFAINKVPIADVGQYLAEGGAAALPVLLEILKDPNEDTRLQALLAVGAMGPEAKEASTALADYVKRE